MAGDRLPDRSIAQKLSGSMSMCRIRARLAPTAILGLAAWLLAGCGEELSPLHPGGPAAARIAWLWWVLLSMATVVFVVVMIYLVIGLTRSFRADAEEADRQRTGNRIVVIAGIVIPAIILLVVMVLGLTTLRALARPNIPDELTVHVIGHQWWWEVHYPYVGLNGDGSNGDGSNGDDIVDDNDVENDEANDEANTSGEIITANEIHIPVGRPVRVLLNTEDVIHSFWVPELHGKLDLVPGRTNEMWLQADTPGVYRGVCAEFCGIQHAKMQFVVVAEPWEDYVAWLNAQAQPAAEPTEPLAVTGAGVFMVKGCANCHTVRGTAADGDIGPDLTHLADRLTLAAATLPNTKGHLAGWITDPQHNKPGAFMPPTLMDGDELEALLAYLASLE